MPNVSIIHPRGSQRSERGAGIISQTPKVSIILAVYNGENYLEQSIRSALNQTHPSVELVVVDDGSEDRTADICRSFQSRILYVRLPHVGLPAARNEGIQKSSGQWVALLDHDDLWVADKLERQMALIRQHPEAGLVFSDYDIINPAGQTIGRRVSSRFMRRGRVFQDLFDGNFICSSSIVYRKDVLNAVGLFDERFSYALDWHLSLRVAARYPLEYVDTALAVWRWRPGYEEMRREIYLSEMYEVVKDIGSVFQDGLHPRQQDFLPVRLARISCALARYYITRNEFRKARRWLDRSLGHSRLGVEQDLAQYSLSPASLACS